MKKFRIYILSVFLIATIFYINSEKIKMGSIGASVRSSDVAEISFSNLAAIKEEYSGTLYIFIEDKFEKGKTKEVARYFLYGDREVLEFIPTSLTDFENGQFLKVSGTRKGNILFGDVIEKKSSAKKSIGTIPVNKNDQKVAVFLVNFLDSGNTPFDVVSAQNIYFSGSQIQNFYKEQSYGKATFSGKVYGWITLPRNSNNTPGSMCGAYLGNGSELDPYISALNINLNSYDHVLFQFDCTTETLGNLWGLATVGKINYLVGGVNTNTSIMYTAYSDTYPNKYNDSSVWSAISGPAFNFTWTNFDTLVSHEMGHALGVLHANSLECGAQTLSPNCFHIDYGNFLDVMGFQYGYGFQTNAYYKEVLGFINNSNSINISQSGTYTIGLFNSNSSTIKSAKIKINGANKYPYYLEYRKSNGFDTGISHTATTTNQNGLLVNRVVRYPNIFFGSNQGPSLLDMTPSNQNVMDLEYSLNGNNTFVDPKSGISIGPIISQTNSSITFNVNISPLPSCTNLPLISNPYSSPSVLVGSSAPIIFGIFNDDALNCNTSKFTVSIIPPTGWPSAPFNPTNPNFPPTIDPGQIIAISAGSIFVPSVIPGIYNYTIQVNNLTSGVNANYLYPIQVN